MFETITRPFAKKDVLTTRRIVPSVSPPADPPPTAILSWGSAGTLADGVKQDDGVDLGTGFKVVHTETWKEGSRKTKDFRIENPDDPSQYVTERRTTQSNFGRDKTKDAIGGGTSSVYTPSTTITPAPAPVAAAENIPIREVDNTAYYYLTDDPGTPLTP